jgi:hypothetical protein
VPVAVMPMKSEAASLCASVLIMFLNDAAGADELSASGETYLAQVNWAPNPQPLTSCHQKKKLQVTTTQSPRRLIKEKADVQQSQGPC